MAENLPGPPKSVTERFEAAAASHRLAVDSSMPGYHATAVGLLEGTGTFTMYVPPERPTLADVITLSGLRWTLRTSAPRGTKPVRM